MKSHDDIEQFREYVADQFYRIQCNLDGVEPRRWRELRPEVQEEFRRRADRELALWMKKEFSNG